MFEFKRDEDDQDEPPSRSILGLERVGPSTFPPALITPRPDEEPPNASILGLAGMRASEVALVGTLPRPEDEPPTRSFLGLEGVALAGLSSSGIEPGSDSEPPNASILGLGGIRTLAPPLAPATRRPGGQPASRPFAMERLQADLFPAPTTTRPPREAPPGQIEVPEFESDVQHKPRGAFPVERAVLFSLAAHILLLVFLLSTPLSVVPDAGKGLLAALVPPEESAEQKIPVIFKDFRRSKEFRESPGPARQNPRPSPLSDKTRRAGGGQTGRQHSETPFIPERPGIQGLEPGGRKAVQPSRPALGEAGEKQAATAPGERAQGGPEAFRILPPGPNSTRRGQLSGLDSAVEEAAKATVQGEAGAGFANPEGGLVDTGPVSFETTWYPWGEYAEAMIRRIKLHWDVPRDAWFKGKTTIRFYIHKDGHVSDVEVLKPSANPAYTNAAKQAILTSDPFRPLPKDLLGLFPNKEGEHVTVTFFYNYRPSEVRTSEGPD
ncbi:MAG: TonB family protein [Thermoanaerobaculia bacterium]